MEKIRLLDLCCGAGGCSVGYKQAADELGLEIEITGIDNNDQPNYPFYFEKDDAMRFLVREKKYFTHVHASPPCQAYCNNSNEKRENKHNGTGRILYDLKYEMYMSRLPGVIENVLGAPLCRDYALEGRMFGLKVIRRRIFETINWFGLKPGKGNYIGSVLKGDLVQVAGHGSMVSRDGTRFKIEGNTCKEMRGKAMDIDWMTTKEMTQAIPPAYTKYIGLEFLKRK
jgi:DNA (cytosine-5)-methyltransferase 1